MKLPNVRKYPKLVHITPEVDYRVKFVRRLPAPKKGQPDDCGSCDPSEHTIRIRLGMTPEDTFRTLVHEVLHAFEFEYDIDLPHKKVYQLENAIASFIMMNF